LICPECDGEFVQGVWKCPDCQVALVPPKPEPTRPVGEMVGAEPSGESVVVLETGRLFEADMATSALEEAGVPHYRQVQSSSGLSLAMPVAPSAGPGVYWVVRVPEEAATTAKSVLDSLPLEAEESPGVWDFGPTEDAKSLHRTWALALLVLFAAAFLTGVVSMLRYFLDL